MNLLLKKTQMREKKYNIGDKVFHITPESDQGVVLNIKYDYLTKLHEYLVTFSAQSESLWYYEHELSTTKIF